MSRRWSEMTEEERAAVVQVVDVRALVNDLVPPFRSEEDWDLVAPSLATVHAYASGALPGLSGYQIAAIEASRKLSKALDTFLGNSAIVSFPAFAAASTGELIERQSHGYAIRLVASRAHPERVFLQIAIEDDQIAPHTLIARLEGKALERLSLEDPVDKTIQVMLAVDAPLVMLLLEPRTKVFLQ